MKECKHCGEFFDLHSREKILAGGKINECPDCVEELGGDKSPPKYLGVAAGNGKMSDITIIACNTEEDKEKFARTWRNNNGQNKGKACQLGNHLSPTGGIRFSTVHVNESNGNHKGKQ